MNLFLKIDYSSSDIHTVFMSDRTKYAQEDLVQLYIILVHNKPKKYNS